MRADWGNVTIGEFMALDLIQNETALIEYFAVDHTDACVDKIRSICADHRNASSETGIIAAGRALMALLGPLRIVNAHRVIVKGFARPEPIYEVV